MKKSILFFATIFFLIIPNKGWSQIPIYIPTALHDVGGKINYDAILTNIKVMAVHDAISMSGVLMLANAIGGEFKALTTVSPLFELQKFRLTQFIFDDSYGYIELKYPLIPKIGFENNNSFGNVLKRQLFKKKFTLEKTNIENYVAWDNPITEGQRLYLILNAVENVIKTTLEDEGL